MNMNKNNMKNKKYDMNRNNMKKNKNTPELVWTPSLNKKRTTKNKNMNMNRNITIKNKNIYYTPELE